MTDAYGHTRWSLSEFQEASPKAKWQKRKARVIHCLLSLEDPSNKAIAEQLGLKAATVGRVLAMEDVREAIEKRFMAMMDIQAVTAMALVEQAMKPDQPFAMRLHTAKWLLERRDKINARILHKQSERLPNEDSAEARLRAIVARRNAKLAAKAIDAQVVGGNPCQTAPGSSSNETPQPSSEASGSGPTPESPSTSSPTSSSDSASSSNASPSPS